MIINIVVFLLGIGLGYALHTVYLATRPEGSPWRPDVRKWWGENEDLMEVERRRNEEINARDFAAANGEKSPVVKRIESYSTPAEQGQRDTPPHTESDRLSPEALRQPGVGSEGRDAATSDHYRSALVLDANVNADVEEVRNADLVLRYFRDRARVIKDRHGEVRWVSMLEAEALLARSELIFHRGAAAHLDAP